MQSIWGFIAGAFVSLLAAWITSRATNRATKTAGVRVDIQAYTSAAEITAKLIDELREEQSRLRDENKALRQDNHRIRNELAGTRGRVHQLTQAMIAAGVTVPAEVA